LPILFKIHHWAEKSLTIQESLKEIIVNAKKNKELAMKTILEQLKK
jgi:hypothetical protein